MDNLAKMQILKAKAKKVLKVKQLRHTPNKHDIELCSENARLLHMHQQNAINKRS